MDRTVIFACVHNAGRSQIAAALFNQGAPPGWRGVSAGTQPATQVHPAVVKVMQELGIDLADARPQKLTPELAQGASLLVTMGCGENCPYIPGLHVVDWKLDDPKGLPAEQVRIIRDDIGRRVKDLLAELLNG